MKTNSCDRVQDDLKAYIDNELPLMRRLTVGRHLTGCAACQEEKQIMEAIGEEVRAAAPPAIMTNTLRSRLLATVAAIDPANTPPEKATRPLWRRQPALVFGTLAAAMAVVGVSCISTVSHVSDMATVASSSGVAVMQYAQDYDEKVSVSRKAMGATPGAAPSARVDMAADRANAAPPPPAAAPIEALKSPVMRRTRMVESSPAKPNNSVFSDASGAAGGAALPSFERKVHKEASLGVQIAPDQIESKSNSVEEAVKAAGGFVASNNLTTDAEGDRSADIETKVPVERFDAMLKKFGELGKVTSKNVTGEDLTEKISDAQSAEQVMVNEVQEAERRVKNATLSERRLGQKEYELRESRIRLAQERARLGLLRRMSALATIHLNLTEKAKPVAAPPKTGFWGGMDEINHAAIAAFQTAVRVPLILVMWILAFSPIWAPLIVAYRWASRRGNRAIQNVTVADDTV